MLLPDETLGVPSLFKIMPQLMVELIGSSKREGYQECKDPFLFRDRYERAQNPLFHDRLHH